MKWNSNVDLLELNDVFSVWDFRKFCLSGQQAFWNPRNKLLNDLDTDGHRLYKLQQTFCRIKNVGFNERIKKTYFDSKWISLHDLNSTLGVPYLIVIDFICVKLEVKGVFWCGFLLNLQCYGRHLFMIDHENHADRFYRYRVLIYANIPQF